jgi:hypothetical protein
MLRVGQSRQEPLVNSLGCFRGRDTNSNSKLIIEKRHRDRHAYGSAGAAAGCRQCKMMEIMLASAGTKQSAQDVLAVSVFMALIVIKCVKIRSDPPEKKK